MALSHILRVIAKKAGKSAVKGAQRAAKSAGISGGQVAEIKGVGLVEGASGKKFYKSVFRAIKSNMDNNFFGHSEVNKQNIVENPPKQVPQLGKDGFYSNVKNCTGKL